MFGLGGQELLVLMVLGVLLFGRKLPEVGRSLGKTVVEFKNGMRGIESGFDDYGASASTSAVAPPPPAPPQRITASAPKFEGRPFGLTNLT